MSLRDNGVDQVRLGCQTLEEHVAARRVTVTLGVHIREIWLQLVSARRPHPCGERRESYLNDRQELLDLTRLYRLDLQLNLLGVILGSGRLEFKVEGQHRGCLSGRRCRLLIGILCLRSKGIEFTTLETQCVSDLEQEGQTAGRTFGVA